MKRKHRLNGKTIFLSASIPSTERNERYRRVPDAHIEIDEAVISLTRAVLAEGGRLVFGGHPSISRLVAMVAGEYLEPRYAEPQEHFSPFEKGESKAEMPSIIIYQSRAFEEIVPNDTMMLFKLGYAEIKWVEASGDEKCGVDDDRSLVRCPRSLNKMRNAMIAETKPVAMVCIGGMEGVEEEAKLYREYIGGPIYIIETTGGAAALLAEDREFEGIVIDRKVLERIRHKRKDLVILHPDFHHRPSKPDHTDSIPQREFTPYSLIMQEIVHNLIDRSDNRQH